MSLRALPLILVLFAVRPLLSAEPTQEFPDAASFLKQESLKEVAAGNPQAKLYRLTVSRSFDPVLIVEIDKDALFLKKVRLIEERKGDFITTSFCLVRDSRIPIDPEEYSGFKILLGAGSFWDLPTKDWRSMGLDGSSWMLEGIEKGKYHCVQRSSPFIGAAGTPLNDDLKKLSSERAYAEGRLIAVFTYLWGLSGEANEKLY